MVKKRQLVPLDGKWKIAFDPDNEGKAKKWFGKRAAVKAAAINVPSVWNLARPGYTGVAWYFKDFRARTEWRNRAVRLKIGAANYYSEIWLNGRRVGCHEGGYTPFTFDISRYLVFGGANRLVVRVVDPPKDKKVDGFIKKNGRENNSEIPCSKEWWGYYDFGGIWQSVELIITEKEYIQDCFVIGGLKGRLEAELTIVAASASHQAEARFFIRPKGRSSAPALVSKINIRLDKGVNRLKTSCNVSGARLWSPESPNLYSLIIELHSQGRLVDAFETTFGFREFDVTGRNCYLNGRKIILKGILMQPHYPKTLVYPINEDLARREIRMIKQAGFNMCRLHIKTAPPVFIRLADEMGLLLYEEPPIGWMKVTPQMEDRCLREVREMVLRDRNHPSVILWGIANEGWGGSSRLLEKLCKTARTLDPSRPILDNSGGFVTEALRFTNCGSLYPPYSKKAVSYYDGHRYAIVPVDESTYRGYQTLGEAKQFSFLSEFGYSAPEDIRRVLKCFNAKTDKQLADYRRLESSLRSMEKEFKKYGLSRIFKDYSSFSRASQKLQAEGLKRQIEAVRSNPKLSAYCLTQFADAANEMGGGMVDSWRNPKPAFRTLKQANEPLHIAIHLPVRNVYAGKRANIEAVLINDAGISGKFSLSVRSENPKHKVVFRKSLPVRVDRRILKIYSDAMSLQGREGRYTVRMDLLDGKKVLAHSDTTFFVFKAKASRIEKVILLPREKQIADFFRKKGIKFTEFKYRGTHNRPCVVVVPNLGYSPLILRHEVTITEILDKITDVLNMVYMDGCTLLLLDTKLAYHFRMPYDFREHFAGGGFSNTFHFVKKHEVFRGLPMNCLMGDEFCNIIPIVSHRIMDREPQWNDSEPPSDEDGLIESECLAGSFHASYRKSWWASNLTCKRHGKGNIIFSQFRIVDNLGKDPLADRLLCNMLEFGQKLCSGHG